MKEPQKKRIEKKSKSARPGKKHSQKSGNVKVQRPARPKRLWKPSQLDKLSENSRSAVAALLQKVESGGSVTKTDIRGIGGGYQNLTPGETLAVFHTTAPTLSKWVAQGMPKNVDGTYDTYVVHCWLLDQVKSKSQGAKTDAVKAELENKMKGQDSRLKELRIKRLEGKVIDREKHEMIMASRMSTLRTYWENTFQMNLYHFVQKDIEELRPVAREVVKKAMNAYLNGSRSIE